MVAILQHYRQAAEVLAAGVGHHAIDHFLLQHEMHFVHQRRERDQMKQQGAGNVVGQVADDLQRTSAFEVAKVEFQRVALVDAQPFGREALLQAGDQITVDLDHMQVVDTFQQRVGQGAQSRTDFHHRVAGARRNGINDLANDSVGYQKVLAKPFPCGVPGD